MKPVNTIELNRSYRIFLANFIGLISLAILCLYFFFAANEYEYQLLKEKADQTTDLISQRKEINTQFDIIQLKFNQLSRFTSNNPQELDDESVMLEDIQDANFKIKNAITQQKSNTSSFQLYQKMTDEVTEMARIQDSLFNTRFQIESMKSQLESCLRINRSAEKKLSLGRF